MLYPGALANALLKEDAASLSVEKLTALGTLAEILCGARLVPVYTGDRLEDAEHILAGAINHLVEMGVATEDVSALIVQSQTRGARSQTNRAGLSLIPDEFRAAFAALALEAGTPPTLGLLDPARWRLVRSLR